MTTDTHSERPTLSLWDAISLIIGIVVASSIYESPPLIFSGVAGPWWGLGVWLIGGALSLIGALVFAELATTYPRLGGEYNYLTRAYGPACGFLFGWAQLIVIQTGNIAALSYVFAGYAKTACGLSDLWTPWLAASAVAALTALQLAGLRTSAWTQNVLTILKLLGLTGLILAGLSVGQATLRTDAAPSGGGWPLSLILVMYAYGGWNDAAFVAAEVRNVRRNIPLALLSGLGAITVLYLLINLAYLRALGFEGLRSAHQPAAATLTFAVGPWGGTAISWLVVISTLGGVNGLIFSASRVHATVGSDHRVFAWLGRFSRGESPIASLVLQAAVSVAIILSVGTQTGRDFVDAIVQQIGFNRIPWSQYPTPFDTLLAGFSPVFWLFFLLTGLAYFVLRVRVRDRYRERPFRAPLFPLLPLVFVGLCGWMLYSSAKYGWPLLPVMAVALALGLPVYWFSSWGVAPRKR